MRISRRQVLAAAAAVPVVGTLAAGGVAWRWWDRPPGAGLQRLSEDEHDFVQALAEAWIPPGGDPPLSGADARLGRFLDEVVAGMEPGMAREFKLLLQALDDLPLPTRFSTFRALPLADRQQVMNAWLSRDSWLLRSAVVGVMVLLGEGFAMHPDVIGRLRPHFRCGFGP